MTKEKRVSIRLSEELHNKLFELACETGMTITQIITLALKYYLEEDM